jgi:lysophospholipase L1-like esterase
LSSLIFQTACTLFPRRTYFASYYKPEFECSREAKWKNEKDFEKYMQGWQYLRSLYNTQNMSISKAKNVIAGNSLVQLFSEDLIRKEFPNTEIVNRGIGGDSTFTFLLRLEDNVLSLNPSVIFLEIGGNDLIQEKCLEVIEENVKEIVRRIKAHNPKTKIVFLSVPPTTRPELNSIVPVYNAFLIGLANSIEGVYYLDTWKYFRAKNAPTIKEEYIRPKDAIHFSEKGYEVWGQLMRPYIAK